MKTSLAIIFLLITTLCHGQPLQFQNGMLMGFPPIHISSKKTPTASKIIGDTITKKDIEDIKKTMLPGVEQALRILNDDSLGVRKFYTMLWNTKEVDALECNLELLYDVLTDRTVSTSDCPFTFVPSDSILYTELFNTKKIKYEVLNINGEKDDNTQNVTYKIIKNKTYQQWLINRYNTLYKNQVASWDMINYKQDYEKGWQELEQARTVLADIEKKTLIEITDGNDCSKKTMDALTKFAEIKETVDKNFIIQHLNNKFYKDWLWYTGGILTTNPFFITDANREYPSNQKYTYLTDSVKNAIRANKENTVELLKSRSLYNLVELPYTDDRNKKRNELWHIVLGNKITNNELKKRTALLTEDDIIKLCVHNVKTGVDVEVEIDTFDISDKGPFTDAAMAAADTFGNAFSSLITGGVVDKLQPFFDLFKNLDGIKAPKVEVLPRNSHVVTREYTALEKLGYYEFKNKFLSENTESSKEITVLIDSIPYELHGIQEEDKRFLITRYLYYNDKEYDEKIVEPFIKSNLKYKYELNYSDTGKLKTSIIAFFNKYKEWIENIKQCRDKINELGKKTHEELFFVEKLLNVHNRSLPPKELKPNELPDAPEYSTHVVDMPIIPRKEIKYEVKLVENKKINDKDSTIHTNVYKDEYKTGGKYLFIASAGIAYIWPEYTNNVASYNDQKQISRIDNVNPRLMVTVGLNIYPWKFYSLDKRSIFKTMYKESNGGGGFLHRTSLYTGLGISKGNALEHFFAGPAFDIYPGLKLTVGCHLYKNTRYEVYNNIVATQYTGLRCTGFTSVNLDPTVFVKIITNLFN
jgi:hypothetical protein